MEAPWFAALALIAACGGRVSEPDGGAPAPQASNGSHDSGSVPGDLGAADSGFEVCPADPPQLGTACDLAPHTGCAYVEFQGPCESFLCVDKVWQSAHGDGC